MTNAELATVIRKMGARDIEAEVILNMVLEYLEADNSAEPPTPVKPKPTRKRRTKAEMKASRENGERAAGSQLAGVALPGGNAEF